MLTFDEAVSAMQRQTGWPREKAETIVRNDPRYAAIAPAPIEKDADVLEKAEQIEIRKIAIAYGFKVDNLSQYRPSKIAVGFPDLFLRHKHLPVCLFWESKRQIGGALSPAQQDFRDDCVRCNERHGYGDRYAFVDKLIELEIAVRGAGPYGIEPLRHLRTG